MDKIYHGGRYKVYLTRIGKIGFEVLDDFDSKADAEYFANRVREASKTAERVWVEDTFGKIYA